jgi:hypothetical protein
MGGGVIEKAGFLCYLLMRGSRVKLLSHWKITGRQRLCDIMTLKRIRWCDRDRKLYSNVSSNKTGERCTQQQDRRKAYLATRQEKGVPSNKTGERCTQQQDRRKVYLGTRQEKGVPSNKTGERRT